MKIERLPFDYFVAEGEKLADEVGKALDWFSSLKISNPSGRYNKYRAELIHFSKTAEVAKSDSYHLYRFLNAQAELVELIRVFQSIQDVNSGEYISTLKKVASGQAFRNTAKNDSSRDFLFELSLAARFLKAGFSVSLNQIADLVVTIDERKIYVEAKRIRSTNKLEKNIRKASTQIGNRLGQDKSSKSRGLIAINVTDLLNENNNMVVHSSASALHDLHEKQLNEFFRKNERIIDKGKKPKRLGVLGEYTLQGIIYREESGVQLINLRGTNIRLFDLNKTDDELVRWFAPKLGNQFVQL